MPKVYYLVKNDNSQEGGNSEYKDLLHPHKVLFSPVTPGYPVIPGLSKIVSPFMPPVVPGLPFIDEPITPTVIGVGPPFIKRSAINVGTTYPFEIYAPNIYPTYTDQKYSDKINIPGTIYPAVLDKLYYHNNIYSGPKIITIKYGGPFTGYKTIKTAPGVLQQIIYELKKKQTTTTSSTLSGPLSDNEIPRVVEQLKGILRQYLYTGKPIVIASPMRTRI